MLEGLMAPLRIVGQRGRADWLLVAATWLVILCATTLLVIGVMYGDAVALSGLRQRLAAEPPPASSIEVAMRVAPAELTTVDDVVTRQTRRVLAWADGELIRTVRSGSFDFAGGVAGLTDEDLAVVAAIDALSDHATLVTGGWPTAGRSPVEVTLPGPAADRLGLAPGDRVTLSTRSGPERTLDVLVVGVWEPDDPEDRYWVRDGLELTGVSDGSSFTLIGPFVVDSSDVGALETGGKVDVTWRAIPDFANLALSNVRWMRSDAAALDDRIAAELGPRSFYSVSTDLPAALGAADRSLLVSRSGVLVLAIQFAILAGYALILVAGLLAEQRRIETALLRSRGAGPRYLAGMALLEGLVLVVPAVFLAPLVALGALSLFDGLGPLGAAGVSIQPRVDGAALLVAGGTGLACLVGLLLPAMLSGGRLAAVRQALGRQGSRSLPARLGIDLALVALAGIGLWQLRQYGAPLTATVRGSVGLDPLLVAAPAIGLLAGAILALRVVPLLAQLAERAVGRQAGLVGPLGARQLARRPLRYTRSALLLLLAAALGTFAAAYTATWAKSQVDQADYRTGGDLRVEVASFSDLPSWAIGAAYSQVDGVQAAMPVVADSFDVAGRVNDGQLVGVDAGLLPDVASVRPDLLGGLVIDSLADALAPDFTTDAVSVPGRPESLILEITTDLESVPLELGDEEGTVIYGSSLSDGSPIGTLSVAVRDAAGPVHILDATRRLAAAREGQALEVSLTVALPDGSVLGPELPIELLGLQILLQPPLDTRILGEIEVSALAAIDAAGRRSPIEPSRDWRWLVQASGQPSTALGGGATADPTTARIGEQQAILGDAGPTVLRLVSPSLTESEARPLPALVSDRFSEMTGSGVGDTLAIGNLTRRTQISVVGVISGFPTLDAARPFVVADLGGLALSSFARNGQELFVDEWWLRTTDPGATASVLSGDPYSVERVTGRDALRRTLSDDPVALGVIGALVIGAVAALIVAVIGYVVSAVVSTRERLGEFALLQAIGLSPRQLATWLSFEFAFLLGVGTVIGSGLGLLLAWLVLPFVTLTADAQVVMPPITVEIPWTTIAVIHLMAALALVGSVLVVGRVLRRVPVSGILRGGQD